MRFSVEERELIERLAAAEQRPISNWIRLAVRQHLYQKLDLKGYPPKEVEE